MASVVQLLARRGNYDEDTERFIREMPKVELHVHLDGSFDPNLIYEHLQREKDFDRLPTSSVLPWDRSLFPVRQLVEGSSWLEFHSLCTCRGKRSLHEMIKCFEIFMPLVRGNLELIEQLSFDFCKRQAEQRVMYTECRYSPHLLAAGGSLTGTHPVDAASVLDAVQRGLRRGSQQYGIQVNQILCCINWRPDWAEEVVELAHQRRNDSPCAVVAVDIAAGEEHFNATEFPHLHKMHLDAMEKAQRLDLNITLHAGEVAGGKNVKTAIESYGAKRIGHGYRIANDKKLMDQLREKGIHVETCPTSSRETGGWDFNGEKDWTKHPCVEMVKNGVSVSFNSDDPAVFNTSLSWQYRTVVGKMKRTKETLVDGVANAIDAAFCSDEEKQRLHQNLLGFLASRTTPSEGDVSFSDRVIDNRLLLGESL